MRARFLLLVTVLVCGGAAFAGTQGTAPAVPSKTPDLTDAEVTQIHDLRIAGKSDQALAILEKHPALAAGKKRALGLFGLCQRDLGHTRESFLPAHGESQYMGTCFEYLNYLGWVKADPAIVGSIEPPYALAVNLLQRALEQPGHADDPEALLGHARALALDQPTAAHAKDVLALEDKAKAMPAGLYLRTAPDVVARVAQQLILDNHRGPDTIDLLQNAVRLDPNELDAKLLLARELANAKQDAEANTILNQIEKDHPERNADVFYLRAQFAQTAGNVDEALALAEKALTLSGRNHAGALVQSIELRLDKNDLDQVRADVDRLMELSKRQPLGGIIDALYARYFIARASTMSPGPDRTQMLREAEGHCANILGLDSTNAQAKAWLAQIQKLQGTEPPKSG